MEDFLKTGTLVENSNPGCTALILYPGISLADFKPAWIPKNAVVFAVDEAIHQFPAAAYWVASDRGVLTDASLVPAAQIISCGFFVDEEIHNKFGPIFGVHQGRTGNEEVPLDERPKWAGAGGDGSIVALCAAKFIGASKVFFFGMDLYRTLTKYSFDGRKPRLMSERAIKERFRVRGESNRDPLTGKKTYSSPKFKRNVNAITDCIRAGIMDRMETYMVGSPLVMQNIVPYISVEKFLDLTKKIAVPLTTTKVAPKHLTTTYPPLEPGTIPNFVKDLPSQ
jgi:hypothetical protein